jgi:GNAT superfamily N-acetyltransferase
MPDQGDVDVEVVQMTSAHNVTAALRQQLIDCWIEVTNSGGAAGFPFPPVDEDQVTPAADVIISRLDPQTSRLLIATREGFLVGWVLLHRTLSPLVSHWGSVSHLQTRLTHRDHGVGSTLMRRLRQIARDELGLEQLHLAARGGAGLEYYYTRLGWREVGRWPNALRLSPTDTRDEILMILKPL